MKVEDSLSEDGAVLVLSLRSWPGKKRASKEGNGRGREEE